MFGPASSCIRIPVWNGWDSYCTWVTDGHRVFFMTWAPGNLPTLRSCRLMVATLPWLLCSAALGSALLLPEARVSNFELEAWSQKSQKLWQTCNCQMTWFRSMRSECDVEWVAKFMRLAFSAVWQASLGFAWLSPVGMAAGTWDCIEDLVDTTSHSDLHHSADMWQGLVLSCVTWSHMFTLCEVLSAVARFSPAPWLFLIPLAKRWTFTCSELILVDRIRRIRGNDDPPPSRQFWFAYTW